LTTIIRPSRRLAWVAAEWCDVEQRRQDQAEHGEYLERTDAFNQRDGEINGPTHAVLRQVFLRPQQLHRTGRREDQGELASDDSQEDVHVQQAWVQQRSIVIERSERLRAGNGGQMWRRTRRAGRCPPGEWHI
jgi:hypothetical protein